MPEGRGVEAAPRSALVPALPASAALPGCPAAACRAGGWRGPGPGGGRWTPGHLAAEARSPPRGPSRPRVTVAAPVDTSAPPQHTVITAFQNQLLRIVNGKRSSALCRVPSATSGRHRSRPGGPAAGPCASGLNAAAQGAGPGAPQPLLRCPLARTVLRAVCRLPSLSPLLLCAR